MSELEKAILEHPQIPMLRKAFIQDGLQTSVEGYLAHIGEIFRDFKYESSRADMYKHDRELAETFIKFIATHLLKDFKEIMSKADFDEQTIKLFGRGE